jgi:hypothetical protein
MSSLKYTLSVNSVQEPVAIDLSEKPNLLVLTNTYETKEKISNDLLRRSSDPDNLVSVLQLDSVEDSARVLDGLLSSIDLRLMLEETHDVKNFQEVLKTYPGSYLKPILFLVKTGEISFFSESDSSLQKEIFKKLQKVIKKGPKAGVYTSLFVDSKDSEELNEDFVKLFKTVIKF